MLSYIKYGYSILYYMKYLKVINHLFIMLFT